MTPTTEPLDGRRSPLPSARFWAWPAAYLALRLLAPFIHVPYPALGTMAATVLFLLLPLLWLQTLSGVRVPPMWALLLFAALALVWGEALLGQPFGLLRHVHWKAHPAALGVVRLAARPVADLALITAAALMGHLLARLITDPKMLLPVALAGGAVDYWGVYAGTTHAVIKAAPQVVTAVSAGIPAFGGGLRPVSFVGFGDWLFLSMFLTVAARYDLQPRRTFWTLLALLIPAMLLVLFGPLGSLPAIVPMALAIFIVNGRRLKLSREETFATLYALLMVAALIGAYTWFTRRH